MAKNTSPWFNCLHKRPGAKIRLLCFPWAGGGSNTCARWGANMDKDVEVIGIRLPGRENRRSDPFITDRDVLAKELSGEIAKHLSDKPLAFFGHSMGTMVAYETAMALRKQHSIELVHLFFSGSFAAHSSVRKKRVEDASNKGLHSHTDAELIEWLTKTGGTPKQILENEEYMKDYVIPVFRADLELAFKYYRPDAAKDPFSCGITFIDGDKDSDHQIDEFKDLTSGKFKSIMLPGGHFYLMKEENAKAIQSAIADTLLHS